MKHPGRQSYSRNRCGGWAEETADMIALLGDSRLLKQPRSAERNSAHIPGMICQPPRPVRVAYWWATALQAQGWRLCALGDQLAGGGFIAEIAVAGDESMWIVFPRNMPDDGTEASALANVIQRLTFDQRNYLRRLVAAVPGNSHSSTDRSQCPKGSRR
ncbi:hypothetical protein FZI85_03925 [Mycobacterium sp. CBMA293]|uniref:hypothetical protein n=1 Tax=unclassified Mycolicibacterium TaxID=2636767 RepID=UPI0012DD0094|nr:MULTISPECIES: hypothetical protein [unclassified Mycolicibacterium]MUL47083.1 hypothetical protein [Mycolicibacterium sp. CBMA 360]MUL58460.1 hypothetical protein [Mycolicibacterium sp. CBMA 335]MUL73918.1 hypothetical protein [Mycolicibacterium sp. CBMA 311]MUL93343.1 hypothetical protein [Mycolicibacterium sp. CBMA 230]MUM10186.1 hypothetical protein [Mycolicibacterium sp. CBMA 293]